MNKNENVSKSSTRENDSPSKESVSAKNKAKTRGKKRKRFDSDSSEYEDILPDNMLEIEKNLQASAIKNNLNDVCVRKIIRKVVKNDHVLAIVKLREEEEEAQEENNMRPKMTRSKVKELMKVSPKTATWNLELTPIKHIPVKTRPEVKALIAQELQEDEDDEEYEPTHDDVPSDDDQGLESCSDLDSQPRTPATPHSQHTASPMVVKDGPFKVPQDFSTPTRRKLDLEEEATIARRTRSKLSLSATSIEHIESTFVPPDDLPMPAVDDLWNQFLNECLNPASVSRNEDDDEADPEYNVAADPDAQDEDEEALGNSIIKISKKELNDLVTELFNIMPEGAADDLLSNSVLTDTSHVEVSTRWEGKQEPLSDDETRVRLSDKITFEKKNYTRMSIGKTEPQDLDEEEETPRSTRKPIDKKRTRVSKKDSTEVTALVSDEPQNSSEQSPPPLLQPRLKPQRETVTIRIQETVNVLPEQKLILQQQLRQHIQLATSNFLQLYVHPVHWKKAPCYKEYLNSLQKLANANTNSVVNVCNLKQAVELVTTWENTVSANTPENRKMVEFIEKEIEKSRRSIANKNSNMGQLPDTFKKVVANSPVFLYPYLLPIIPYRADPCRRFNYLCSEDRLIALGLDQFWQYVENNPDLFKPPPRTHPRHRWGLGITMALVSKYMFPWITQKVLLSHVQNIRKIGSHDNPIKKFFDNREITPVKHKLLPYNPKLTLYEHPEHEVPRMWVRYLAKTSHRFKHYMYRRPAPSLPSGGVDVQMGQAVQEPSKNPLPISFTKEIISHRQFLQPKSPQNLADKFDLHIQQNISSNSSIPLQANIIINTSNVSQDFAYKLVETSTGAFLMPVRNNTVSVNCNTAPIISSVVTDDATTNNNNIINDSAISKEKNNNSEHCTCCVLLRKICKTRQTSILEYFGKKSKDVCECKHKKYPRISNRLKLLVSNYKNNYKCNLETLNARLKDMSRNNKDAGRDPVVSGKEKYDQSDLDYVNLFNIRLITVIAFHRDAKIKSKVHTVLSRYNPYTQDPIELMNKLYEACGDLIDIYKEFLGFLTVEQAEKMHVFRDYFLRSCVPDIVKKVEDQIQKAEDKKTIMKKLYTVFYNTMMSACDICTDILTALEQYPKLAKYVFSLFPHRTVSSQPPPSPLTKSKETPQPNKSTTSTTDQEKQNDRVDPGEQQESLLIERHQCKSQLDDEIDDDDDDTLEELQVDETACDDIDDDCANMDYEADHSTNVEDDKKDNERKTTSEKQIKIENYSETIPSSTSVNFNPVITVSKTELLDHDDNNTSMLFEEVPVKQEASEWKRDEDKVILQLLKEHLTREERQDKTIVEIIEEKNLIELIGQCLLHKSIEDVRQRVIYLLELLVLMET